MGKGLSQLLDVELEPGAQDIPLSQISANTCQPRKRFDDGSLEELAQSIREHGVIQPLIVRPTTAGRYEIIAGERRFRAAQLAGLRSVPVVVRNANAQTTLELAIIENVQRVDISPIEAANAYAVLSKEFGLTQEEIASRVGKSRTAVTNLLRLLKLPNDVLEAIDDGRISEGHGRALLALKDPSHAVRLLNRIVEDGLSVRQVEDMVAGRPAAKRSQSPGSLPDPDWEKVRDRISEHLGANVQLNRKKRGGRLVIEFFSDDEMESLLGRMGLNF